mgnify:CR=1 FL=1
MPACILNTRRRPIAGQEEAVLKRAIGHMEAHGRPGFVTTSLATLAGNGGYVTNTIQFESFDALAEVHDGILSNESAQNRLAETASLCQSVETNILERIKSVEDIPDGFVPKYMVRVIFTAKLGMTRQLIEALLETRESNPGMKPAIFRPISSAQRVRGTRVFAHLDDVRAELARIQDRETPGKWVEFAQTAIRMVDRIHYRKRP